MNDIDAVHYYYYYYFSSVSRFDKLYWSHYSNAVYYYFFYYYYCFFFFFYYSTVTTITTISDALKRGEKEKETSAGLDKSLTFKPAITQRAQSRERSSVDKLYNSKGAGRTAPADKQDEKVPTFQPTISKVRLTRRWSMNIVSYII